jgi:hypothetical protein
MTKRFLPNLSATGARMSLLSLAADKVDAAVKSPAAYGYPHELRLIVQLNHGRENFH